MKTSLRKLSAPMGVLMILLSFLALVGTSAGQVADNVFKDFKLNGDFEFVFEGEVQKDARIYLSDSAAAYLIRSHKLKSPIMISPRTQSVESIHEMKLLIRDNGWIDFSADARFEQLGGFQIRGTEVAFSVKGSDAVLRSKPPLVGVHPPSALFEHDPKYLRSAQEYAPDPAVLGSLRSFAGECEVKVYFGNWCPTCGRLVPKVLKVQEELEGSAIAFEYYGLPQDMRSDPVTAREDLHGVPTVVVSVGGREIGRLGAKELNFPEKELAKLLAASGAGG